MSVPGLSPVGLELATLLRLSGHGPLAAASASNIALAAADAGKTAPSEPSAPSDLGLLAPGEAPTDASIGIYSSDIGDPTRLPASTEAALAAELQATAVLDDQLLMLEIEANNLANAETAAASLPSAQANPSAPTPNDPGAAAQFGNSLADALSSAIQSSVAQDALNLFQAVEAGDAANAAAVAARLQPSLASLGAAPAAASEPAAVLGQLQSLVASARAGDMTGAAALAQAIQAQVQSAPPPEAVSPLLMQMLAPTTAFPAFGGAIDPMLMAMQWSLLLGAKATLGRLRKLREDRVKILAIAPFGGLHEDETREDE